MRNAYDLVWHSNGAAVRADERLGRRRQHAGDAVATAGRRAPARIDSATNGAYTGPAVPALTNVATAQDDYLYRVAQGGYYGHPNPARCEWVLNGGNPTSRHRPERDVGQYPVGVAAGPQLPRRRPSTSASTTRPTV